MRAETVFWASQFAITAMPCFSQWKAFEVTSIKAVANSSIQISPRLLLKFVTPGRMPAAKDFLKKCFMIQETVNA
jgi:FAD synthase